MPKCGTKLDMSLNFPMKKVTQSLLALLLAALPVTGFAAAADVLFSQKNSSNTAWANVIVAPTASSAMAFNSSKVPISTQALTLSSVTSPAASPLTLGTGASGAAITVLSASNNVGIGTTSPVKKLEVIETQNTAVSNTTFWSNTFGGMAIQNPSTTANTVAGLNFLMGAGNSVAAVGGIQESSTLGALGFFTSPGGNIVPERMRISSGGTVTISSSIAGSASAGALVVTGGLATGAASYFGGNVTLSGSFNFNTATSQLWWATAAAANSRSWAFLNDAGLDGNFSLYRSIANTNSYLGAVVLNFDKAGAATFAGAVTAPSVTATTTLADQGGTIAAQRNGLAPRQGLVFDGTAGATVASVPAFGNGDFTVSAWVRPNSLSVGYETYIVGGATGCFALRMENTTGLLSFLKIGGGLLGTSSSGLTAGKWALVTLSRSSGSNQFYLNGVAIGSAISNSADYTVATTQIGNIASNYPWVGGLSPLMHNRALSAAEVLALYQSSAPEGADYNGVLSNVNLLSAGGPWTNYSSSFNVAFASADGSTVSGTSSTGIGYVYTPITLTAGSRYRITGTATGVTGSTLYVSTTAPILSSPQQGIGTIPLGTSEINFSWEETTGGSRSFVVNTVSAIATSFALTNLRVWKDGLLLAPDSNNAGAGLEWLDVSGNRAHIVLPTSGVSWSLPSSQQIVIEASTSTNGNQQLGGASLIDVNKQWRIQSWTVNCSTGTPTISLGNVSAGAQYNAAAVLAAGNNDITLVTRFPSTANLWVNSNSTATLIHRITLVPAN
jgi:hypothetical protein